MRSLLKQSATVWDSGLSKENIQNPERVQKTAIQIILQEQYQGYKQGLTQLDLQTLESRMEVLCLNFAVKCTKNSKMQHMFPLNSKTHSMNTRMEEKYEVKHANTERLRYSAIIYMQNL